MDKLKLYNGVEIPRIGLGVYMGLGVFENPEPEKTVNAVKWALEAGYRHIDVAAAYGNEAEVGEGIRVSGVAREEIFLTTKLWNDDVRAGTVKEAFETSLKKLRTKYLDLYLIHWPVEGFEKAWAVLEDLYSEGRIRAIGVSNFKRHHLEYLIKNFRIKPMVNQVEANPYNNNQELIGDCKNLGIVVEAWSPLGGSGGNLLGDEAIRAMAQKYQKTPAQVVLRWNLQRGVVILPKSLHQERIISNFDLSDFELLPEDMELMDGLNRNLSAGTEPEGVIH